MRQRIKADPVGHRLLIEQPVVRSEIIDMNYLRGLPKYTFGYRYTEFMDDNRYAILFSIIFIQIN